MSQIVERFRSAVESLLGDGPVKNRLCTAYTEHLEDLAQVELPIPGNGLLGELHQAMHSIDPAGRQHRVAASIRKMSPAEATRHAGTILRLYTELLAMELAARAPAEAPAETAVERPPRLLISGRR